MKHWIVNTETLLVYCRDKKDLLHDEAGFETEFDANKFLLSKVKKMEDKALNDYNRYCRIGANAAMRMKDLTC